MDAPHDPYLATDDPEPLLGGTLYLMSTYRHRRCAVIAHKIAHNLDLLARNPNCSEHLRRLCSRMRDQWRAECGEVGPSSDRGGGSPGAAEPTGAAPARLH